VLPCLLIKDNTVDRNNIIIDTEERIEIRIINVLQARKLRSLVLRPDQAPEMTAYVGDYAPDTLHFGAFKQKHLVGIVTVMHQAPTDSSGFYSENIWLLRGMATLPEVRRQGYGATLVRSGCAYVASEQGISLWCDARENAVGFYHRLGFVIRGNRFNLSTTGPHYRMWHQINAADAGYVPF
jgi:ribosomal protein S18 acetylase RimI-like enzyme